jgi:hypothetical protein
MDGGVQRGTHVFEGAIRRRQSSRRRQVLPLSSGCSWPSRRRASARLNANRIRTRHEADGLHGY